MTNSAGTFSSGAGVVDDLLGQAYMIVKHVYDNLTPIADMAARTTAIDEIKENLDLVEGSVLSTRMATILEVIGNYRTTFEEAVADIPSGTYFSCSGSGSYGLYLMGEGGTYTEVGDLIEPLSSDFIDEVTALYNNIVLRKTEVDAIKTDVLAEKAAVLVLKEDVIGLRDETETIKNEAINYGSALIRATWDLLEETIGGDDSYAMVVPEDTGTHTDPITTLVVSNSGIYRYSIDPIGWTRVGDLMGDIAHEKMLEATAQAEVAAVLAYLASNPFADTTALNAYSNAALAVGMSTTIVGDGRYELASTGPNVWTRTADDGAGRAYEWAESAGEPGGPGTKSAKGWAEDVSTALANVSLIQTAEGISMLDGEGYVAWRLGPSGVMENVEYQQTQTKANAGSAVAAVINPDTNIAGVAAKDDNGAVALLVDASGNVLNKHIAAIETTGGRAFELANRQRDPAQRAYAVLTKLTHILLYGQSLAAGVGGLKNFLNYPTMSWAKMYQGGLRERNAYSTAQLDGGGTAPVTTYNANFRASLVAAQEANQTDGAQYGETGMMAAMEMVSQLLLEEDGIDIADIGQQFMLSSCAEGSTRIANLTSGNQNYQRITDSAAAAQSLAASGGVTPYGLGAMLWRQMERDIALGTASGTYTTALRALLTSLRSTYASATGIDSAVPCIAYQTDGHRFYSKDATLTSEVYDWIVSQADVALSCPIYMFPSVDGIHRDHIGYLRIGAYEGIALKRWLFDQVKPRHLQPGTPIWTPNAIVLPFDVPAGRLTVDTDAVSDPGSYGFSIVDPDLTTARTITAVEPLGTDRVIIRYSGATLASGAQLRLGWGDPGSPTGGPTTGSRTNLRDQQGESIIYRGYAMHNWAPICSKTRA